MKKSYNSNQRSNRSSENSRDFKNSKKFNEEKISKAFLGFLISGLVLGAINTSYAQDDLLEDTESILNSDQIDIDGSFKNRPQPTAADRLEKYRKTLEDRNEQMVQKKIENIRLKEEQKLTKKLKDAFQQNMNAMDEMDSVSRPQAAPVRQDQPPVIQQVIVAAPKEEPKAKGKNKITPKVGMTAINNNDTIDFESNTNFGIDIESEVSPQFSFGLGFTYMTVDFEDRSDNIPVNYLYGIPQSNAIEIAHKNLNISAFAKLFLVEEAKIRPFLGVGVGYNRSTSEYSDQVSQINNFGFIEEVESVQKTFVSGSLFGGAEVAFSESIGALIEFRYDKSMSEQNEKFSTNSTNLNSSVSTYDARLDQLNAQINNSDNFTLSAGLQVRF